MNMGGLGSLLQREIPSIRAAVPSEVNDLLWPREREAAAATGPVITQSVTRERSTNWILPLVILALIPGLLWLFSHGRRERRVMLTPPAQTGSANRVIPETPVVPKTVVLKNTNVYFDTGSARLRPDAKTQLDTFAGALASDPNARVAINGYTDNVGSADSNMRLSQERADAVKADLVSQGIPADHLTIQGNGEENPVGDNATNEGRGSNRRVSVVIVGH
jgi:outer membrane protein OmpA-like peptidoglycan-associated protein